MDRKSDEADVSFSAIIHDSKFIILNKTYGTIKKCIAGGCACGRAFGGRGNGILCGKKPRV